MIRPAVGMWSSGFLTARKRCCKILALVRPAQPATMWPNLLASHQVPQESGSPQESDEGLFRKTPELTTFYLSNMSQARRWVCDKYGKLTKDNIDRDVLGRAVDDK